MRHVDYLIEVAPFCPKGRGARRRIVGPQLPALDFPSATKLMPWDVALGLRWLGLWTNRT